MKALTTNECIQQLKDTKSKKIYPLFLPNQNQKFTEIPTTKDQLKRNKKQPGKRRKKDFL